MLNLNKLLSYLSETYNLYVMREQQIFNNTELDFDDYILLNFLARL